MKIEMLASKLYRGSHAGTGLVFDAAEPEASEWIAKGWARKAVEVAPLTVEEADALVPTKLTRRNAKR